MQKEVKIKTKDNKVIYGTLCTPTKAGSVLVIFIPGLAGDRNEHPFFNGARFLKDKGISSYRLNFQDGPKNARKFEDNTIHQQAEDLGQVVKYFKPKYKKIFLVGHSMGGPTILLSNHNNVSGLILWDPTNDVKKLTKWIPRNKKYNAYVLEYGLTVIFGDKMWAEYSTFPSPLQLIKKVKVPIKIISAGANKALRAGCKKLYQAANEPKALAVIKNANHNFDHDGNEEDLFNETYTFIKKFS